MNLKRLIAALLVTAALLCCGAPAMAASSSFDDITDQTVALNADVLRFMGVVSGKGGNRFDPDAQLTRAEFCTMAIGIMGKTGEVAGQLNRTIFSDVSSTHWGRGYINLAATTAIGGDSGERLISGVGNGRFEPDRAITYGEAVTILVRLLGFSDADVGHIWPYDYVSKAEAVGLAHNLVADPLGTITRAQAAQLFVNLLTCPNRSGALYCTTLGTATAETILLSLNVTADDGTPGAVMTSQGRYLPAGTTLPTALLGQKGIQVINKDNRLAAFIPDSSSRVNVTLSGKADAAGLTASNGIRYAISASTPVYSSGTGAASTYAASWQKLISGLQITLYTAGGKVTGLYFGSTSATTGDAVIVRGQASAALFQQLTGGASHYQILKDRQPITMEDIRPYDVATYDSVNNTLLISDLRVTAIYENVSPSLNTPENISVLGVEGGIDVLPCAVSSLSQFRPGHIFTLLLTADGKVAGAITPTSEARPTAVGLLQGSAVTVPLPSGGTLVCNGADDASLDGQLVTVSSTYRGRLNVSRLTLSRAPGDFHIKDMTLGQYPVAAGLCLYEQVGSGGSLMELSLGSIEVDSIPASKISNYALNSSGMVDILVLDNVTGSAYRYGILHKGEQTSYVGAFSATNRTVAVENSSNPAPAENSGLITGYDFENGTFGGVAEGASGRAASLLTLTEVTGVSPSAFFTAEGRQYVNANGWVYQLAAQVECYNSYSQSWFTGEDALTQALAFGNELTLYLDPMVNLVRVISVK